MKIKQIFLLTALFIIFSAAISAQNDAENQTTADEDFQLNITNKEVTETNYEAKVEVAVESDTKPAVALKVGAGVRAEKITLRLTNITGDVRFRGSLEGILEKIKLRRSTEEE